MIPAPPFRLVDNDATWLDRADLVFIDPVGTGYSRAAKPELNTKFHSLRGDIESVGEFIRMYLTPEQPMGLAAVLDRRELRHDPRRRAGRIPRQPGHRLQRHRAGLLALDFQGFVFSPGNDLPYLTYLPSYTAAAWYHKKLPADLQASGLRRCSRKSSGGPTASTSRSSLAATSSPTRNGTRPPPGWPATPACTPTTSRPATCGSDVPLLPRSAQAARRSVGRFDSRYQGIEGPDSADRPSFDPSLAAVRAPYTSTFNQYIHTELNYKSDLPYYILGEGVGRWDWQREMGYPGDDPRPPRRHVQEPPHEGPDRLRLLRPRHAVSRRRARPRRLGTRPQPAHQYRDPDLRGRAHDVPG